MNIKTEPRLDPECVTPFPPPRRKNCVWTDERRQQRFLQLVNAQADHYIFWPNELLDFARHPPLQDPERAAKDDLLRQWHTLILALGKE